MRKREREKQTDREIESRIQSGCEEKRHRKADRYRTSERGNKRMIQTLKERKTDGQSKTNRGGHTGIEKEREAKRRREKETDTQPVRKKDRKRHTDR